MANYTFAEYADIIYVYGLVDGNEREAVREYERRFPNRRAPQRGIFQRTFQRLRDTGCVTPNIKDTRGGTSEDAANLDQQIISLVKQHPETSTRRVAQRLGVSSSKVWRVLHTEGLKAYHHTPVQGLLGGDCERRWEFCSWLLESDIQDRAFLDRILWTDESQFTRDGIKNFHNLHTWSESNPHQPKVTSFQNKFSVNVWAGIIGTKLIGPFILPQVLNSHIYAEFLEEKLPELLEDIPLDDRQAIFYQHDGAPAHTARIIDELLQRKFGNRRISRNGPIAWPPRSPDLTPLDFFLWGTMKAEVYSTSVDTKDELMNRITTAATKIRNTMADTPLKQGIKRRLLSCIQSGGGHFEQFL